MGSQLKTKGAEFSNQLLMTLSQNVDTPSSSNRLKGEIDANHYKTPETMMAFGVPHFDTYL